MYMHGHCGPTVDGERGDCDIGDKGWFGLQAGPATTSWEGAAHACAAACLACDRCRFVSFSLKYRDCSWFENCDLSALLTTVPDFRSARIISHNVSQVPA